MGVSARSGCGCSIFLVELNHELHAHWHFDSLLYLGDSVWIFRFSLGDILR